MALIRLEVHQHPAKALTQDGIERTFALNVVAPYALTAALLSPSEQAKGELQTSSPRYRHSPVLTSTD
jgi:hypothetical protein